MEYYYICIGTRRVSCAYVKSANAHAEMKRLKKIFPKNNYYVAVLEWEQENIFEVDLQDNDLWEDENEEYWELVG